MRTSTDTGNLIMRTFTITRNLIIRTFIIARNLIMRTFIMTAFGESTQYIFLPFSSKKTAASGFSPDAAFFSTI